MVQLFAVSYKQMFRSIIKIMKGKVKDVEENLAERLWKKDRHIQHYTRRRVL